MSFISNCRGILSGNRNSGPLFTIDNPQAPNDVNRVVMQIVDGAVTVNAGSFAIPSAD